MELAEPGNTVGFNEENLLNESGTALSLPVKVKLENPMLGSTCYIGSNAHPIVFALTEGTSRGLRGHFGSIRVKAEGNILEMEGGMLVDGSFGVPGASGCFYGRFGIGINAVIDEKLGVPTSPGVSKITLFNAVEQAGAEPVREHSK